MRNSKRLWRALLFVVILAALCGSFALPVVSTSVNAAPPLEIGSADLSLLMTVSNTTPNKTDNVIITITVTNTSTTDVATNVTVQDLLPAGLTYVDDNGNGTYDRTTGTWVVGAVGVSSSVTLNITTLATTTGPKTNTAQILTSTPTDPNPANNTDSKVVTPKAADLSLTMTVDNPSPSVGELVTFKLTLKNDGPDPATGLRVNDLLPAGLAYVSHSGSGTYTPSTGNWTSIGTSSSPLGVGATKTLNITARVLNTGSRTNSAEVTEADQLDPDSTPANGMEDDYASIALNAPQADLSLTMTVNKTTPNKADDLVFTITVTNAGPSSATGVTVKFLLPAGLTYISDDSAGKYKSTTGIWSVGSLLASGVGSTSTLTVTARASTTGQKVVVAEVWSSNQSDPDSAPANGRAEDDYASVTITPAAADLFVAITVDNSNPGTGSAVLFTITISNAGPDTASGVTLMDALPAGYTYQSDTGNGTYNPASGIWTVGSLPKGTSASLKITAVGTSNSDKTNAIEVWTSDQLDPDSIPGNNSTGEDDDDAAPKADLSLNMTVDTAVTATGSNVVFKLTIKNDGPAVATGVVVKDVLPSGLAFVSTNGTYDSATGFWNVGSLAVGAAKSVTITAKATAIGTITNAAEVWLSDQFDTDSVPGDGSTTTDDDASVTVTVSYPSMTLLINEVAWMGTSASTSDEWIELYNPGSTPMNLSGWTLKALDGTPTISLTSGYILQPYEYYLLERTDDTTVSDITADQIYTGELGNSSEVLQLLDPLGRVIDTANSNGGSWPAGSTVTYGSMERRGWVVDSDTAWITNTGVVAWGKDAGIPNDCTLKPPCITQPKAIKGTPKHPNWANSVTPTPSPVATAGPRPTPTRTLTPPPPPPLIAINEFVPRPGHDWNHDGVVNVGDEYIELLNHGTTDVNLSGWRLDDEVNVGSNPYSLPAKIIKPGERIVFFGSDTGLLLGDGGDGVRLLKPNGQLMDAYNYSVVGHPDQSYCRLPDNGGADDWNQDCYPTPGLQNSLNGESASPSTAIGNEDLCPISDTLPYDFVFAECDPFGKNIWRAEYWDRTGWYDEKIIPGIESKWPVFAN